MSADSHHDELPDVQSMEELTGEPHGVLLPSSGPVRSAEELADRMLELSTQLDGLFDKAEKMLARAKRQPLRVGSDLLIEEAIERLPVCVHDARVEVGSFSLLPTLRRCLFALKSAQARIAGGGS